jgi:glycosyltransferase involved in cell wall biosynthesis
VSISGPSLGNLSWIDAETEYCGRRRSARVNVMTNWEPRNHRPQAISEATVSVIVPCYNQGAYLAEAVGSLVRQTHTSWECIIVNDGSTDDSLDIARRLASKHPRVRIVDQRNRGLSAARNRGLLEARGGWIQLLDADDLLEPDALARHQEVFRREPATDVAYSALWILSEERREVRRTRSVPVTLLRKPLDAFVLYWERGLTIPIHAFTYRTSCFQRWGIFDERLPNHEDWDIHLRFSAGGGRYGPVPTRSALYRIREGSMTGQGDLMHQGKCLVLSKHVANHDIPLRLRLALARRLVHERLPRALETLRKRQFGSAVRYTLDAGLSGKWSGVWIPVLAGMLGFRIVRAVMFRMARKVWPWPCLIASIS